MRSFDYSVTKYKELCISIIESNFTTCTVNDFLTSSALNKSVVIFRHDVDRAPEQALVIAQEEAKLNINSTYYFRSIQNVFITEIIQEIAKLGHEIGYHYETLAECKGDFKKAIDLFEKELTMFRTLYPVTTISMHGRPLSKFDNRDLWKKFNFTDYGITGECYLSIDYSKVLYLSDTGRTWHPTRYNVRDKVTGQKSPELDTTKDLINYIKKHNSTPLCLLTHPNRWTNSPFAWSQEWLKDQCINQMKQILIKLRS